MRLLRQAGGQGRKVETFSYPPNGIISYEINNRGVIAGVAYLAQGGEDYFIRKPDGKMILFGLNKVGSLASDIISINDEDEAIGAYTSNNYIYSYDIIRSPDGKIIYYDPPNSPGTLTGTVINNRGVVARRSDGGLFLLTPKHCE
jgi:hypothetical protein